MVEFQVRIRLDLDLFFLSDPDPSRSFGSPQCDLSYLETNWNPSHSKSAGSEIPEFTFMYALLNGP
jgi:hypothetical protein